MALPLGGDGEAHHAVIEMHYDNPDMLEGIRIIQLKQSLLSFVYKNGSI